MLTLKNLLTISSLTPVLSDSSAAADAKLKGLQLACGRTKARVESLRSEHAAAYVEIDQKTQNVGELRAEELDVNVAIEELRQAEDRFRALEAALAIAIRKDEAAHAELKKAERQISIDAEVRACAAVRALAPRGEEILAAVHQYAMELAHSIESLRVMGGNEKYAYGATEIRAQFGLFLGLSAHPTTNRGHVPSSFRKYKTLTACLEAVCGSPQP